MTTKEKQRRKAAADKHRLKTPPVIAIPPTSDQAAADATINTESAPTDDPPPVVSYDGPEEPPAPSFALDGSVEQTEDDLIPNTIATDEAKPEPLDQAISEAAKEAQRETLDDKFIAFGMKIETWSNEVLSPKLKAANDWVVDGWIKLDGLFHKGADALLAWSYKQQANFGTLYRNHFPKKATEAQLMTFMSVMTEQNKAILKAVQGPLQVEAARVNALLDAHVKGHKAMAVKAYASLTGLSLGDSRAALEAFV